MADGLYPSRAAAVCRIEIGEEDATLKLSGDGLGFDVPRWSGDECLNADGRAAERQCPERVSGWNDDILDRDERDA